MRVCDELNRSLDARDALYATTIGYAVGADLPFKSIERVTYNNYWKKDPGDLFMRYNQSSFFRRPPGPRYLLYAFAGSVLSGELLYKYLKSFN